MVRRLAELARLFLKLGTISFGGPAAHLALMEHEVVKRRGWLDGQQFLDLVAATNLIPGPNAVEMASHIGYRRAGFRGSVVAGLCFTVPAVAITAVMAAYYVRYGSLPEVESFLFGIKPAILAVIFTAVWRLGRRILSRWQLGAICGGVALAVILGSNEIWALLIGGLLGFLLIRLSPSAKPPAGTKAASIAAGAGVGATAGKACGASVAAVAAGGAVAAGQASVSIWQLGLFFLKVGAVMYGGGYVLVAYIEGGLVGQYGFTQQQLLDAVAMGQLTPGPMLTTATFVGYVLAGWPGAAAATVGILTPCFAFVAAVHPLIPRLRESRIASMFLDAVNAASLGLIVAVAIKLAQATLVDWRSVLIAAVALGVSLRWRRVTPAWLVLGGAAAGKLLLLVG